MKEGQVQIFKTDDFEEVKLIEDRKQARHCLAFSPDGAFLAVGSNDNIVDVYDVNDDYNPVGKCSKASSFITQLDWAEDSQHLAAVDGAGERLVYTYKGKHVTKSEDLDEIKFATITGVIGPDVEGVFPKYSQQNDVNNLDVNFDKGLIGTGDDFGLVKIFRYPAMKQGSKFRKYNGHSAHVTNVLWTSDNMTLLSTGGADHALFQWRLVEELENGDIQSDDEMEPEMGIDSNSEASDSSDDDRNVDSDIEMEKEENYEREVYKDDLIKLKEQADKSGTVQKRGHAPKNSLELAWCAGYRGHDCRDNVQFTSQGEVVFHSAALGIVLNRETGQQRFYNCHTDDIISLTIHPSKDICATGQVDRDPAIHVWDIQEMKTISIFQGVHERGVCALEFTNDGKRLLSVGLEDNHQVAVWDWRRGECISKVNGSKDKVFCVISDPLDASRFVTTGVKHIKFWRIVGATSEGKRGICGDKGETTSHLCGAFGKEENRFYSGTSNGKIYVWIGTNLNNTVDAHSGPCFTITSLDEGFISGGKDGIINLWSNFCDEKLKEYAVAKDNISEDSTGTLLDDNPPIRTIIIDHGKLLAGSKNGEILEIDRDGPIKVLAQGHGPGELWGLTCSPVANRAATYSDDGTVRIWDLDTYGMIAAKNIGSAGRAIVYPPDGSVLAIGQTDGGVIVLDAETLEQNAAFKHRKQNISDLKFDPFGRYLAVGSHENAVDIYSLNKRKRIGICRGASSYITHVDWSTDGKVIQINSGAKERLFYEIPSCKRVNINKQAAAGLNWERWSSVLGPEAEGIWPPYTDVTDVNATHVTKDNKIIATGDDFGLVKLFAFPSTEKHAKCKKYLGHAAHVTNVRWNHDDTILVSTGGGDCSILIWKRPLEEIPGDYADSSEDEDGDYFDSDVEEELKIDYQSQTNRENLRDKAREITEEAIEEVDIKQDITRGGDDSCLVKVDDRFVMNLKISHVFGYRGYDARSNADFYISPNGPEKSQNVIYHTAGVCVIHDYANGNQRLYSEHSDDVLCLTNNKHPSYKGIVASGQLGGHVHVWSSESLETLSLISGLPGGVSSCSFSGSGRLLLTSSLDRENTVAVYRWQTGQLVGSKATGPKRIFQAVFRPDSDSKFVTVGEKSLFFWNIAGSVLLGKKAQPGNLTINQVGTCLSMAFGTEETTFTGMSTGSVIVWSGHNALRVVERAHNGPIFAMFTTLTDGLIVTGGKEKNGHQGAVKLWDSQMKKCKPFNIPINNDTKNGVTVKSGLFLYYL